MNDEAQLEVRYVPIGDVKPWEKNPKKHNIPAIIASIKRFGRMKPISVQKGTMMVIAGHGRLMAMKQMGFETIPITEHEMPDAEAKAYALVDNETTISGGWDDALLKVDLQEIKLELPDLDMADFGFSEKQTGISAKEDNFDTEAALKQIEEPITKLGDVITLGEHRLMCGDSTKKEDVDRLMQGKKADMTFTDPPYSIMGSSTGLADMEDDNMVAPFFKALTRAISDNTKLNGHVYICCNWKSYPSILHNLHRSLVPKNLIVWHKPNARLGSWYSSSHELISLLSNDGISKHLTTRTGKARPILGESNVWTIPINTNEEREHFATKPMAVPQKAIEKSSDKSELVLDIFGGSGTTLMVCENSGRVCYMMEISPRYCDVIVKRWEDLTGLKAVRPSPAK